MRGTINTAFVAFAVFSTFLMLSSVFVQPVSAQICDPSAGLQVKEAYIKALDKISNDEKLFSTAKEIAKKKEIKQILEAAQSVKTEKELKNLITKYLSTVSKQDKYKQIESLLNTEYKQELTAIKKYINKIKTSVEIKGYIGTVEKQDNTGYSGEAAVIETVRFSSGGNGPDQASSSTVYGRHSSSGNRDSTIGQKSSSKFINGRNNGNLPENNPIQFKVDMDGTKYINIPGYGWWNPSMGIIPGFWGFWVGLFLSAVGSGVINLGYLAGFFGALLVSVAWILGFALPQLSDLADVLSNIGETLLGGGGILIIGGLMTLFIGVLLILPP